MIEMQDANAAVRPISSPSAHSSVVVWRDLKASTAKQADDVLAALDALKTKPAST